MLFKFAHTTGVLFSVIALATLLACAEDPSKHPDENASSKRETRINKELDSAQEYYLAGINLQITLASVSNTEQAKTNKTQARQKLEAARSIYKSVLRRDDLEKYEGRHNRYEIEKVIAEIEGRIRELEQTDIPETSAPTGAASPALNEPVPSAEPQELAPSSAPTERNGLDNWEPANVDEILEQLERRQ